MLIYLSCSFQVMLLNLLLRNYIQFNLYDQVCTFLLTFILCALGVAIFFSQCSEHNSIMYFIKKDICNMHMQDDS